MHIKTRRLLLKALSEKDTDRALDILTHDEIKKTYLLPDFSKREDALPLFHRMITLSQTEGRYVFGIYLEEKLIGFLNETEVKGTEIELGYVIHPHYQNRGYATEALTAVTRVLFEKGFTEVFCVAFAENRSSIRVMEKSGMLKRDSEPTIEYRGKPHRCVTYSIRQTA